MLQSEIGAEGSVADVNCQFLIYQKCGNRHQHGVDVDFNVNIHVDIVTQYHA